MHRQSERFAVYDAAVAKLKAAGLLYACYETAEELELRRKVRLSRKLPPVYGREALTLVDRAYIIHAGKVLTHGEPSEVVGNADVRRLYLGEGFTL